MISVSILILTAVAVPVGMLVGGICTVFGRGLIWISDFRAEHVFILVPFLALSGLLILFCYRTFGGKSSKGMGLVLAAASEEEDKIPLQLIPLVMGSTWVTHFFGGSAGREGVAVQIGGTVGHFVGRYLPVKNAARILVTAGMAAGFAGLFRTPMAAVLFALEVIVCGELRYEALLPAAAAAFSSAGTSRLLGLEKFEVIITDVPSIDAWLVIRVLIAAVLFGVAGMIFSKLLQFTKTWFAKWMPNPYVRIFVVGIGLSGALLLLFTGRYCGLGTNLIKASFNGDTIYAFDWIFKILLTVATLAAGFQGGEVTPLFSIGASLGAVLGAMFGLPVPLMAALGYIAVFGSATNTLLAPMLIGVEVFGGSNFLLYCVVCIVAFGINRNWSIYGGQKLRVFENRRLTAK